MTLFCCFFVLVYCLFCAGPVVTCQSSDVMERATCTLRCNLDRTNWDSTNASWRHVGSNIDYIINWKPQDVVVWYYSFDNLEIYVFGNLCLVIYVSQRILEFLIILKFRNDDNNNCNVFVSASAKSTQLMNCTWLVTLRGCTILLQKYELHVYISSVWRECDFFHVVLSVVIDIIVYEA